MQFFIYRTSIRTLVLVFIITLLSQCAWFGKDPDVTKIIKPTPVGGYEELGTRIYYPKDLREKGIEGEVIVKAFISREGRVTETRISQKLDPDLDRIAVNAVQRTLFNPALYNGRPAAVWISIPILFTLKDWESTETPFLDFEMIVSPDAAYQNFDVKLQGRLKPHTDLPLRFELLLPYQVEKTRVMSGDSILQSLRVRDQDGEWLIFELDDQNLELSFNYRPFSSPDDHQFKYKFSMNHALPQWSLVIVYGDQQVQFVQTPDQLSAGPDGSQRFAYKLERLGAYEAKYLEVALIK